MGLFSSGSSLKELDRLAGTTRFVERALDAPQTRLDTIKGLLSTVSWCHRAERVAAVAAVDALWAESPPNGDTEDQVYKAWVGDPNAEDASYEAGMRKQTLRIGPD